MSRLKGEYRQLLEAALKAEQKTERISLLRHAIRRAYKDDTVLIAIIRKLLPDLKSIDAKIVGDTPFRLIIDLSDQGCKDRTKRKKRDLGAKNVQRQGKAEASE